MSAGCKTLDTKNNSLTIDLSEEEEEEEEEEKKKTWMTVKETN